MNSRAKPHPRQIYCRTFISPLSVISSFFQTHCFQLAAEIGPATAASPLVPGLPLSPLAPFGPVFPGDPTSPWEPFAPSGPGQPWSPQGPGVPGIPGMPFDPGVPGIPPQHRRKTWKSRRTVLRTCHLIQSIGYRLVSRSHTGALPRRPRETEFPSSLKDERLSYSRTRIQKTWTPTLEQISSLDCSKRW